jgi:hypothetical protein
MSGREVGTVRPTQLIYTYGVGSTVDLPQFSAMVMGLDDWPASQMEEIREGTSAARCPQRFGYTSATTEGRPCPRRFLGTTFQ